MRDKHSANKNKGMKKRKRMIVYVSKKRLCSMLIRVQSLFLNKQEKTKDVLIDHTSEKKKTYKKNN
jgi:hypothetical protein